MSVSTPQPSSRSGLAHHGFPPAPKSVRLWPVVGPSRENDDLVPPAPRRTPVPHRFGVPAWVAKLAVILGILALISAVRGLPMLQRYLGN